MSGFDGFGLLDAFDGDDAMLSYGAWSVPFYHLWITRAHPDTRGNPMREVPEAGEEVRTGNRKGPRLSGERGERIRGRTGNLRNTYIQNSLPHTESIWGVIPPAW